MLRNVFFSFKAFHLFGMLSLFMAAIKSAVPNLQRIIYSLLF